jgi:hypothetical protein
MKIPSALKSINVNFECSHTIGKWSDALAQSQLQFRPVPRDTKGVDEMGHEFEFASLEAMQEVYRKPLAENGLSLSTSMCDRDGRPGVCVCLTHTSDEWKTSKSFAPASVETLDDYTYWSSRTRKQLIMFLIDLSVQGDKEPRGNTDAQAETQTTNFDVAMSCVTECKDATRLTKLRQVIVERLEQKLLTPKMVNELHVAIQDKEKELEAVT